MGWLGLDVGGANIKAATPDGAAVNFPFELWRRRSQLPQEVARLLQWAPLARCVAVTMTGELADCYCDKGEGVRDIVAAVEQAAAGTGSEGREPHGLPARVVRYYRTDGSWATAAEVWESPERAAAANWHALARYAARLVSKEAALLVDIGSTTCDLIPLTSAGPCGRGTTDWTRLLAGELLYTAVERTPVCTVLPEVQWPLAADSHVAVRLAAEWFATMGDVYRILGHLPERAELTPDRDADYGTADGRPADRDHSLQRLRRMLCADPQELTIEQLHPLAEQLAAAQSTLLTRALARHRVGRSDGPPQIVYCGHGDFLLRRALRQLEFAGELTDLGQLVSPQVARCGPAYALACLATEELPSCGE